MIEKIQSDDYQLNINQRLPPDPGEQEENDQEDIDQNLLGNSPTYFNILFPDQSSEDPQPKEEEEEEEKNQDIIKNPIEKSEESEQIEENEQQNFFHIKYLNKNNIQFQNDIEKVNEDNINKELYKYENLTTIIHKKSNIILNLNHDININLNKNLLQYKNSTIKITKNKNYHLNENLIVSGVSQNKITSKKRLRENVKFKCKNKYRKNIIKKYYIKHFIRFLKKHGKKLIIKSKLQKYFHIDKLYSPTKSLILFLIKEDNTNLLLFTVKDILSNKNKILIDNPKIKNEKCINKLDIENYEEIISFFNKNIQDACKLFEESKEFKDYITKQKIIIHNKAFKQKFGFCFIEKNEFIKMIKNNGNSDYIKK